VGVSVTAAVMQQVSVTAAVIQYVCRLLQQSGRRCVDYCSSLAVLGTVAVRQ
jgi:hypothetical protein